MLGFSLSPLLSLAYLSGVLFCVRWFVCGWRLKRCETLLLLWLLMLAVSETVQVKAENEESGA